MATDNRKKQRKPAKRHTADGFVMMAMAVVTLALCMGLAAQAGLSFWLAVTVSAAFYLGLLTLHTLVRRHDQLDELRAEVGRLNNEVARLNQATGLAGLPAPSLATSSPPASLPLGRVGAPAVHPVAAGEVPAPATVDPLARVAAAMSTNPQQLPDKPPAAEPAPQMQKIVRAPFPASKKQQPAEGHDGDRQLPPGPPAARLAVASGAPAAPPEIAHTRGAMATNSRAAGDARSVEGSDAAPDANSAEPASAVPASPSVDTVAARMSAASRREADDADMASRAESPKNADPVAPALQHGPPAGAPWTYRPGDAEREVAFSPSESEVEMIQGLIKKLADEVNSADAAKLALGNARERLDTEALDRSVGALRQAARNMQDPVGAGRSGRHASPPASTSPPARESASHAPARGSSTAPAHKPAPQPGGEAPDAQAGSPAELDLEALMRRAKPIASMTRMPPPLPAAPNIMAEHGKSSRQAAPGRSEQQLAGSAGPEAEDLWGLADDDRAALDVAADATAGIGDRLARIAGAIEAGRVEVFLEPILDLEKNQARHYEVAVRLTDEEGAEISPDDPIEAERPSGALPLLDSLRLKRTAQVAQRLEERKKQGNVFSTFSGQSLTSDDFLSTFAETYDLQLHLAGQLVLTFSQTDVRQFRNPHWTMLTEMRDLGFGFALRAVTDLDMDFEQLAKAGFKFVKLDADVFLAGLPAPGALVPAADLCKHLEGLGLVPVVEALDDETKREQVFTCGVRLGQGNLFGGQRQIKTVRGSGEQTAAA